MSQLFISQINNLIASDIDNNCESVEEAILEIINNHEFDIQFCDSKLFRIACRKNYLKIYNLMVNLPETKVFAINNNAFILACKFNNDEIVKDLLHKFGNFSEDQVSEPTFINPAMDNQLPLRVACEEGADRVVQVLLEYSNVDPTVENLLTTVAKKNFPNIFEILIKHPGFANFNNFNDLLETACRYDSLSFIEMILNYPVNPTSESIMQYFEPRIQGLTVCNILIRDERVKNYFRNNIEEAKMYILGSLNYDNLSLFRSFMELIPELNNLEFMKECFTKTITSHVNTSVDFVELFTQEDFFNIEDFVISNFKLIFLSSRARSQKIAKALILDERVQNYLSENEEQTKLILFNNCTTDNIYLQNIVTSMFPNFVTDIDLVYECFKICVSSCSINMIQYYLENENFNVNFIDSYVTDIFTDTRYAESCKILFKDFRIVEYLKTNLDLIQEYINIACENDNVEVFKLLISIIPDVNIQYIQNLLEKAILNNFKTTQIIYYIVTKFSKIDYTKMKFYSEIVEKINGRNCIKEGYEEVAKTLCLNPSCQYAFRKKYVNDPQIRNLLDLLP